MELYEMELKDAVERIRSNDGDENDFIFEMSYLTPEPDGGGMFKVEYEIKISNVKSSKSLVVIGGIEWKWVDYFERMLREGYFD